jgi:hypothetical protein
MEDLYRGRCETRFELLPGQLIRHAIQVPFDVDVVIDICANGFTLREFVTFGRQGLQRRLIQFGKQAGTASFALAEPPLVEFAEPCGNGLVQFRDAEELLMAQRSDDPALGY